MEEQEDMKVVKFRVMVDEIQQYLSPRIRSNSLYFCFCQERFGFKLREKIYIPVFVDKYSDKDIFLASMKISLKQNVYDKTVVMNKLLDVINDYKKDRQNLKDYYNLVFWLLFMAAINDEIYNNELSNIIDLAYCLEFNEAMIRDWCKAVEYVLKGNRFRETCDLQLETEEGKTYFLHA